MCETLNEERRHLWRDVVAQLPVGMRDSIGAMGPDDLALFLLGGFNTPCGRGVQGLMLINQDVNMAVILGQPLPKEQPAPSKKGHQQYQDGGLWVLERDGEGKGVVSHWGGVNTPL